MPPAKDGEPAVHAFADISTGRRGCRACARHDEVATTIAKLLIRPESSLQKAYHSTLISMHLSSARCQDNPGRINNAYSGQAGRVPAAGDRFRDLGMQQRP